MILQSCSRPTMSWKEPKVCPVSPGPEGFFPIQEVADRKPDLKDLLLYRTMSGLSVGRDYQVSSTAGPPLTPVSGPRTLQPCDISSIRPPGGPLLVPSKFSDSLGRGPRAPPPEPPRDQKPQFSECDLMPPPKGLPYYTPPAKGPLQPGLPRVEAPQMGGRAPQVTSTTYTGEQKESIGRNWPWITDIILLTCHISIVTISLAIN